MLLCYWKTLMKGGIGTECCDWRCVCSHERMLRVSGGGHGRALPLTLMLPALLLAACAVTSPTTSPPIVPPPRLAPLPDSARQTQQPSICSPSCSAALMSEREIWRELLTMPATEAAPASAPMTPAGK